MIDISTLNPVRDLILLDTTIREEKSSGGIVMPALNDGQRTSRPNKIGVILAVGPDVNKPGVHKDEKGRNIYFNTDPGFQPGMKVLVTKYASEHFDRDGVRYQFAAARDVMAIFTEAAA